MLVIVKGLQSGEACSIRGLGLSASFKGLRDRSVASQFSERLPTDGQAGRRFRDESKKSRSSSESRWASNYGPRQNSYLSNTRDSFTMLSSTLRISMRLFSSVKHAGPSGMVSKYSTIKPLKVFGPSVLNSQVSALLMSRI